MILPFSRNWPKRLIGLANQPNFVTDPFSSKETGFRTKIQAGVKAHTFRNGDRWKPGHKIHFWEGRPDRPKTNPSAFELPSKALATHWNTEETESGIKETPLVAVVEEYQWEFMGGINDDFTLTIGSLSVDSNLFPIVAYQDGFDSSTAFFLWFWTSAQEKGVNKLEGQVIHWNDVTVYSPDEAVIYAG